ncbi:MAG TPA: chemotaxis protein CheB [Gemmatimonadales bacterium]|nr:chemotaxis protein CheB [Gemmatimonadales bacterium]
MQRKRRVKRVSRVTEPAASAPPASATPARFDVVALVTSAGGLEAVAAILRDLPEGFPASIIVSQHLGGQGSALVTILSRRTTLPVAWAATGARLTPGQVLVCPPRRQLEVLPDGTCVLSGETTARDKPHDILLESIADSCGSRALAVVLTGMGRDAAVGAGAVKRAGGVVLVQSVETSE